MAIPLLVPELSSALKEDSDAQAKVSDDIVGIAFDPFLNSQDPCGRYDVGTTRLRAGRYRVAVHAVCDGARDQRPSVVVHARSAAVLGDFDRRICHAASTRSHRIRPFPAFVMRPSWRFSPELRSLGTTPR